MPDAFFISKKTRKRKRHTSSKDPSSSSSTSHVKKAVNGKGRPRPNGVGKEHHSKTKKTPRASGADEELDSSGSEDEGGIDDMDLRASDGEAYISGSEDELETPAEKRLRLAQLYLESVREKLGTTDGDGGFDAAEMDRELIASRLKQDVMEHSGKVHKFIADSLEILPEPIYLRTRGHRSAVTSAVASTSVLFTAGKDGTIVRTDLTTGKHVSSFHKINPKAKGKGKGKEKGKEKAADLPGHTDSIFALALSADGSLLASGGKDRKIIIWDVKSNKWVKTFHGHKDSISSLSFRLPPPSSNPHSSLAPTQSLTQTKQLYSASLDRTIKLFDVSPGVMGYVDTLFGHQDHVVGLDTLRAETAVSCGARDRTVRFWKVVEETQLVFRGGGGSKVREVLEGGVAGLGDEEESGTRKTTRYEEGSVDCVAMIDENTFASGGDSGSISLYNTTKKKPLYTHPLAHGLSTIHSSTEGVLHTPRWVIALASLPYGDVLVSGSSSGDVRIWKVCGIGGSGSGSGAPGSNAPRNGINANGTGGKKSSSGPSLSLIGVLPAPGIVNSLQVFILPRVVTENWAWVAAKRKVVNVEGDGEGSKDGALTSNRDTENEESLIIVAGLGKEPRLGRWVALTEKGEGEGVTNGSRTFVLDIKSKRR